MHVLNNTNRTVNTVLHENDVTDRSKRLECVNYMQLFDGKNDW